MSSHTRASRALLFMQQCRQHATLPYPSRATSMIQSRCLSHNTTSLDPDNFGKKLHLPTDSPEPLPEWRLPKPESPAHAQAQPAFTSSSGTTPSPTLTSTSTTNPNPYDFPRARDQPIPRYKHNPAITPGFFSFVKYRILRIPEPANPHLTSKPSFTALTNPYRARKSWPPILAQMSEIQQFHYEKKFRRRLLKKTKAMRFNWDRWALFMRRFGVGFLIFYFALVAEPNDPNMRVPPDGLRYWLYGKLRRAEGVENGVGTGFWPERVAVWIESQYQYYLRKHKRQWDPYNQDGWDDSRPVNSLPGKVSPNVNRPLGDPSRMPDM